jgi:hypothetical protein
MISRKYFHKLILLFILLFFQMEEIPVHAGDQTDLLPGTALQDSNGAIDVGSWSAPAVYDWNSDGKKDLIVGTANAGTAPVAYFENIGTNASPAFDTYSWIQACNNSCTLLVERGDG